MRKDRTMRCPHCQKVGPCLWTGFGKDWVLCPFCQRRVRWVEVEARYLVEEDESWSTGVQKVAGYH